MKIHLVFGLITVLMLAVVISSRNQLAFSFDSVVDKEAREKAQEDYLSATPALPKSLRELSSEDYKKIHWKDERTLWREDGLPFQIRFFHPGGVYDRKVDIFELDGRQASPVRYSPAFFDFPGLSFGPKLPDWVGYAGFRLHTPFRKADSLDELISFLGASNFRAVAKDLVYGATAQAIVLEPQNGAEAEVPVFTKFWLEKPDAFATQFTVYALLESRSVTGAYQFTIETASETRVRVRAKLYFRRPVSEVGYAPLRSMYWFGENTSNTFGDFRPEVHKSDGLLLQRDNGEWIWHPLAWAPQTQANIFDDIGAKGFGLFQRDRDFSHYQDLNAVFHKMPSIWVQLVKGFEEGAVCLWQQPTKGDDVDNVLAYWSPKVSPALLVPMEIEYVLRWFGDASDLPPIGRSVSTRVDLQDQADRRQFFVDFDRVKGDVVPTAEVASPSGATISDVKVERNDFNRSWRVSFIVSANNTEKPTEILCRLMQNDTPVTETWTYTWMH